MTATAHALVGGAIAASIQNPGIGLPLALLSHPFLDMIPHWDFGRGWRNKSKKLFLAEGIFDTLLGLISSYYIFGIHTNIWYFLAAVFASLAFDFAQLPYWFFKWRFPPFSWAYQIQSKIQGRANMPWGIATQVLTIMIVVWVLNLF